jgi:hypothetical protein
VKKPATKATAAAKKSKPMTIREILTDLAVKDALKQERARAAENPVADRYSSGAGKLGIALNMDGAAARTKLDRDKVKTARDHGCQAFHPSGRVDCDALLDFVANNPQIFEASDKPNLALEEALTARVNRKIREEKLLEIRKKVASRAELGQRLKALSLAQKTILEKELKDNPKLVARICAQMRLLVAEWCEPEDAA